MKLLLAAVLAFSAPAYTGPAPDHPFWAQVVDNVGERPLVSLGNDRRALRLVRVPESLIFATVITLEPNETELRVTVKESRDRRKPGAASRVAALPLETWDTLRPLVEAGLWKQKVVAATGAEQGLFDGTLWLLEGIRHGEHWRVVRHEPRDPHFVDLVSHVMRLAGLADQVPR